MHSNIRTRYIDVLITDLSFSNPTKDIRTIKAFKDDDARRVRFLARENRDQILGESKSVRLFKGTLGVKLRSLT